MPPRIIVLGLGPGDPRHLTREAWALLHEAARLYLRTERHPVVPHLPPHLELVSCDDCYDEGADFSQVYQRIVDRLLQAPERPLLYGVPGHPLLAETTTRLLLGRLGPQEVRVVAGLSFLEPVCTLLELDPLRQGLQLIDALDLLLPTSPFELVPVLDPTRPLLAAQLYDRATAADVKLALMEHYPDDHLVTVVRAAGVEGEEAVWQRPLHELDRDDALDYLCTLYVPPLERSQARRETSTLEWICARLRSPEGCPWDREQDHASLRNNLLEEAYETLEALDRGDRAQLREELGDLLLQIFLHAQLAREEGAFAWADVVEGITTKLIRRHPHVFGAVTASNSDEACRTWEAIKSVERAQEERGADSILSGVPAILPALAYAQAIGQRASRVGFDWLRVEEVWAKVEEEMAELRAAADLDQRREELGDLLFALVNLARWLEVEAEDALRETNAKFRRRFSRLEQEAQRRGVALEEMGLTEMDALWEEAKKREHAAGPPEGER